MNCPVCKRDLAPTLSICPSCGAMMNDTVREELQTKITSGPLSRVKPEPQAAQAPAVRSAQPVVQRAAPPPTQKPHPTPMLGRGATADLAAPKTSPTLVGFHNRAAKVPEWRLQMQNAARQRLDSASEGAAAPAPLPKVANAVRNERKPAVKPTAIPEGSDPRLAKALSRISASRQAFAGGIAVAKPPVTKTAARTAADPGQKSFRFNVVTPSPAPTEKGFESPRSETPQRPQPTFTGTPRRIKFDTNKLPKIDDVLRRVDAEEPQIADTLGEMPVVSPADIPHETLEFKQADRIFISAPIEEDVETEEEIDDFEDLAPFSMRFNAGLFDLIIGIVVAMILFSPFAVAGGSWFTVSGAVSFAAILCFVLFVYLTISLAFLGKTLGMRLFSLEVVDTEANEYPTLQQAAVNSSLYILSLMFAGLGFIPMFLNEERRAAHDLAAGTIVVREF